MFKNILFIIGIAWAISACSLTSARSAIPLEAVTITPESISAADSSVDVVPTLTAVLTSTPMEIAQNNVPVLPTLTPVEVVENNAPVIASSNCVPNTDLPVYSVRSGDTLSSIASEKGISVEELARLNCLEDTNLITVGQRLYAPNSLVTANLDNSGNEVSSSADLQVAPIIESNNSASIDVSNIPLHQTTYHGSVIVSPWIVNHIQPFINAYVVEENATITFTWSEFPTNIGITEVGFVLSPNNKIGGYTLIGTDSNLLDGASISWIVPPNTQVDVLAVGKIPGQPELVVSEGIKIGARDINEPLQERAQGTTDLSPVVIFNSPGDVVVDPNQVPITIRWIGVTPGYGYHIVNQVTFYYKDGNGNTTIIGTDADDSDDISVTWQTFPALTGVIYAEGEFIRVDRTVSQVALTMPEIQIDTQIDGCMFFGYGIGAPHPVYSSPDRSTTLIAEIREIDLYPVIEQGELFHHIDLGDQSGWIDSGRGRLVGSC